MNLVQDKLRLLMNKHVRTTGISHHKVAKEAGITPQVLNRFKNSYTGMNAVNVLKLMKYLNLKVEDMV